MSNQTSFPNTSKRSSSRRNSIISLLAPPIFAIVIISFISFILVWPCLALNGAQFRSFSGHLVGVVLPDEDTPYSSSMFYPTISFRDGKYLVWDGEVGYEDHYVCESGEITAYSYSGSPTTAEFYPITGLLLWNYTTYYGTTALLVLLIKILLISATGIFIIASIYGDKF